MTVLCIIAAVAVIIAAALWAGIRELARAKLEMHRGEE